VLKLMKTKVNYTVVSKMVVSEKFQFLNYRKKFFLCWRNEKKWRYYWFGKKITWSFTKRNKIIFL